MLATVVFGVWGWRGSRNAEEGKKATRNLKALE